MLDLLPNPQRGALNKKDGEVVIDAGSRMVVDRSAAISGAVRLAARALLHGADRLDPAVFGCCSTDAR
jgi:hypothetical protein